MGPPPLKPQTGNTPEVEADPTNSEAAEEPVENLPETDHDSAETTLEPSSHQSAKVVVPYTIPPWSGAPCHQFYLEVLKDGSIVDQFDVHDKGAYMFGRVDLCDFVLEHPTISRFHAVLQFKRSGDAYLYDLGSTHGTFINKSQAKEKVYVDLHVGDVIRFGHSSRLYIFQGPSELMLPERDLTIIRDAKIREKMLDQEASLQRARREASLADGISWGMGEDAVEEAEIAHMKKEIDAIRAKDIAQGGLTQGQQTQIARNEQRMTQIMEELENLEETLNDSIRESIGARAGKIFRGKKIGATEDNEEYMSDDDEFYDRTKRKISSEKAGENQSIETADTLLDKRDAIALEIEGKKGLLSIEKSKIASETTIKNEVGDELDAYMTGLSSQLVLDKTVQLEKDLSALQAELDRIFYLLKIADPTGEAAKKRDLKVKEQMPSKSETPTARNRKQLPDVPKESSQPEKQMNGSMLKEGNIDATEESSKKPEADKTVSDKTNGKTVVYTAAKPQWLGAIEDRKIEETQQVAPMDLHEPDHFVDYKDRNKILGAGDETQTKVVPEIESAAPGLILRKRKQVEKSEGGENNAAQQSTSSSSGAVMAEDAVALLLKHQKGYCAQDDEERYESQDISGDNQSSKDNKKPKRVLGPEKPSFLNSNADYESWVPPKGQTGDGRTSLNERYGY
ncbi:Kanadaptin [Morella rubra]|uniref:Kanadaptin n=1 Tax=Morella rubra TaxID=262757 RepID=A0A6A1VF90_9ROSI|nr:Kanadaptin [Morella rubra]